MSLLQLLTVGQSLVNYKDQLSPYRITRDIRLPKFGPATQSGPASAPPPGLKAGVRDRLTACAETPATPAASKPLGRWDLKPKSGRISSPEAMPCVNSAAARLRQGELALDQVKVVRNDLRESDIVVVRAEPPDSAQTAGPVPLAVEIKANGSRWNGAVARLFSAGGVLL
jgi:hypothetical protein